MVKKPITKRRQYTPKQMQINLYNKIFNNYSYENLDRAVKKTCPKGFTTNKCQEIFTTLIINMFYTLSIYLPSTSNRYKIIDHFIKIIPITSVTILPIKEKQLEVIALFCDLMQDHSFGTFINAFLATVLKDLIYDHS